MPGWKLLLVNKMDNVLVFLDNNYNYFLGVRVCVCVLHHDRLAVSRLWRNPSIFFRLNLNLNFADQQNRGKEKNGETSVLFCTVPYNTTEESDHISFFSVTIPYHEKKVEKES